MLKIASLILTSLALFFVSILSGPDNNNISIEQQLPASVAPGEKFLVNITLNKGDNTEFARLLQTLPEGYSAEPVETNGAQFMVNGRDIKFIWTQLPSASSFTIRYYVIPTSTQPGTFQLGGLFSYIHNDETKRLPVSIGEVQITSNPSTATQNPSVNRRMIRVDAATGEFAIILTIHPTVTGATTFIDQIPTGFTADAVDTYGSNFSFENQEARFFWPELKDTTSFNIMYKVHSGLPTAVAPVIEGVMTFGTPEPSAKEQPANREANSSSKDDRQQVIPIASNNGNSAAVVSTRNQPNAPIKKVMPEPKAISFSQNGLAYKVQILATRSSPSRSTEWVKKYYSIDGAIENGQYEGWNKYAIGSFLTYREASEAKVRARSAVKDAFVVAFQNGNRIPVPQALRIEQMNQ
jgi:hypothetical protein